MERRDADDWAEAIVDEVFGPDPDFGQGPRVSNGRGRLLSDEQEAFIIEQARQAGLV